MQWDGAKAETIVPLYCIMVVGWKKCNVRRPSFCSSLPYHSPLFASPGGPRRLFSRTESWFEEIVCSGRTCPTRRSHQQPQRQRKWWKRKCLSRPDPPHRNVSWMSFLATGSVRYVLTPPCATSGIIVRRCWPDGVHRMSHGKYVPLWDQSSAPI